MQHALVKIWDTWLIVISSEKNAIQSLRATDLSTVFAQSLVADDPLTIVSYFTQIFSHPT